MGIVEKLNSIRESLPPEIILVAVSKTKPDEMILEAYEAGQRDFGENKVQDLAAKQERLPKDIRWHMIGHLQSNKVKYLASFVHMIHGVDSLKLVGAINKEAARHDRTIDCLLQVRIAQEETKFGLPREELLGLVESELFAGMKNIRLRGLMGMATYTENREQIRAEFQRLNLIFDEMKATAYKDAGYFDQRSYGMSGDYLLAVDEGSTMVRVGSLIFGLRNY
ncbi:MAG: YggS family pyridoxal phosphate-dependent enzyme [Bacteroidetes bacterium]|nr:YggS family pyridoxal phosphate-dependent enzyme [Bacteroidota bacterium]